MYEEQHMKEPHMNRKLSLALSCLLAEQISPPERLLWRSCPNPRRSSAVRAGSLLVEKQPYAIGLGCLVGGSLLAALAFFSSTTQGNSVDAALNWAGACFLIANVVGLLL